jgi:UDP-N-acetylglucosamine--N-acetylmuramyl-(pentapeptide) pyrophosphoryl-undecaprenol N-acetylglucosamine transferase
VLKDYIYDMPTYMAAADVIICRAGAMTLTEIAMMGKAAILVPSPHVTANHQYKNARALSDRGAAVLIEEKDVNERSVCEAVERIYSDEQYAKGLRQSARAFAREDTDELIYGEISRLIKNKAKIKKR